MLLAKEWGIDDLAVALGQLADDRFEPTWDLGRGEFTWGFGLGEPHPRGQYNAALAAAEAATPGAWWRLTNVGPGDRFRQPTVVDVDFPTVMPARAWWDPAREALTVTLAALNDEVVGRPTSFRITNLDSPDRFVVEAAAGAPVDWHQAGGDLHIHTIAGPHTFTIRRRPAQG